MFSSPTLTYSPSRAVRPVPRSSLHITGWGYHVSYITGAPCNFSRSLSTGTRGPGLAGSVHLDIMAPHTQLLDGSYLLWLHGAGPTHHPWRAHTRSHSRRTMSSALRSGAAVPGASTKKARSRVHGLGPCPLQGPEVLCKTSRCGSIKLRPRGGQKISATYVDNTWKGCRHVVDSEH